MNRLLPTLIREKHSSTHGGIYHKLQIEMTYNSNHIEGSRLTKEQTRYIYETGTVGEPAQVVDIIEAVNHFRCVDFVIDNALEELSPQLIKKLHLILKASSMDNYAVGDYKTLPNEVSGNATTPSEQVEEAMKALLIWYNSIDRVGFQDIIEFHYRFESIHPFQDGNGRVGRLIILKECLKNDIVPFIITEELKYFYYRGLHEWQQERGYLIDTCLTAQDLFKKYLDYFRIEY